MRPLRLCAIAWHRRCAPYGTAIATKVSRTNRVTSARRLERGVIRRADKEKCGGAATSRRSCSNNDGNTTASNGNDERLRRRTRVERHSQTATGEVRGSARRSPAGHCESADPEDAEARLVNKDTGRDQAGQQRSARATKTLGNAAQREHQAQQERRRRRGAQGSGGR